MSNHLLDLLTASHFNKDSVVLRFANGSFWTRQQLFDRAARYASVLHNLGLKAGDRVCLQVEKSVETVALTLGAIQVGVIFNPLNTAYTTAEISYFIGDAEPRLLVCDPTKRDALSLAAEKAGVAHVETLGADGQGSLASLVDLAQPMIGAVPRGPDDIAAILYTSGTTGRSKGAMLSHDNLGSNALTLKDYWQFTDRDVLLHALPIYHTHGLFVAINTILVCGGSMIFLPKFDPKQILSLMPNATCLMGVPTFYTRLLQQQGLTTETTKHMRLFISGSAPLLAETHREWQARTGHAILERYGMTETNMNTSNPYTGERIAGTVGFPLPNVSVRVTDPETGALLEQADSIGMLEVKGPNVFKGYWRMPEKTISEFRADGYFMTGDLGKIDHKGYVHIVGRGKDLIISGGFNVYPKEVETEIDSMTGVVESAVVGVPHPDFGEGVVGVVVLTNSSTLDETKILNHLSSSLAKFKQPKRVFVVDDLPRNTMGKVQKNLLRETYKNLFKQ